MSQDAQFRNPLQRARGLGSAKSGTSHFWWQRVTAIALAVLAPWFVALLVGFAGADLASVQIALARPSNAVLLSVFVVALFWHAKLGLQVVIEDYVHARALEIFLQLLVTLACVVGASASLYAIGRIALMA